MATNITAHVYNLTIKLFLDAKSSLVNSVAGLSPHFFPASSHLSSGKSLLVRSHPIIRRPTQSHSPPPVSLLAPCEASCG